MKYPGGTHRGIEMVLAYLSGPIIHANKRRNDFYRFVFSTLEELEIEVFAPQFLPPASAEEIYRRDVHNVRSCDLLIAEVSNASHGVGMEIMLAIELNKPVLLFHHSSGEKLSRMVLGADGKVLFMYDELKEVSRRLLGTDLKKLTVANCSKCESQVAEKIDNEVRCVACGSLASRKKG
ncbi:MAG: nucleoside 2-deoxyribosyltransferase [Candidatus Thorarchaeota archaeon]|nr:MAG: nucleoside 2-deoxyribosyltransferase [Candidatus Thorarchaeota archaeon]